MIDESELERLRQLLAKQEIHDVLMRYARGVDRLDEALLRSCYHADSHDDHGHFKGTGWDFAAFIVRSLAERAHHTTHAVANVLIELDAQDACLARAESYGLSHLRRRDRDGTEWLDVFAGRYLDRFERRDGVWAIARRLVVHDWSASSALGGAGFPLALEGFTQGRRDRDDPVYRL